MGFGKVYREPGFDRIIVWDSENFNGMRDLTELLCGIRKTLTGCGKTQNFLTGRDMTATREAGFAIILARDAVLGK